MNDDSVQTAPSIDVEEIFQTAKQHEPPPTASKNADKKTAAMIGNGKIAVRKMKSGADTVGFDEGFKATEHDMESEKTMLIETATEDINSYLMD